MPFANPGHLFIEVDGTAVGTVGLRAGLKVLHARLGTHGPIPPTMEITERGRSYLPPDIGETKEEKEKESSQKGSERDVLLCEAGIRKHLVPERSPIYLGHFD